MKKRISTKKLNRQTWLRWQHAGDLIAKYFELSFIKEEGLSFEKFMVLLSITASDKDVTATGLSEQLGRNPNTLSTMLDRMEKGKLVNKERDTIDRRKIWVTMTEKGQQKLAGSVKAGKRVMQALSEKFTEEEMAAIEGLIDKLENIISEELHPGKGSKKKGARRRSVS
jgi:DNA-binding MarR family transcriptional regulator